MFIALLLRAMKRDINIKRVAAFSKRLLQVLIKLCFLCILLLLYDNITDFYSFRLRFSSHHSMHVRAFSFFLSSLKPDHLYGKTGCCSVLPALSCVCTLVYIDEYTIESSIRILQEKGHLPI